MNTYHRMVIIVTDHYLDEEAGLVERGIRAAKRLCLADPRHISRFDAMLLWDALGCVERDDELNVLYRRLSELKTRHKKAA